MVSLNLVGDIGLFREYQVKGIDPFAEITLPGSDFCVGNFEFIIPNNRAKYFFDTQEEYPMDYEYFRSLNIGRFNAFGLANNHCMDYGREGVEDLIKVFKDQEINYFGVGEEEFNVLKFNIQGITFALLGCVKKGRWSKSKEMPFGPDTYDPGRIIVMIKSLKASVDHVIVYPHFGTELVDIPDPIDVEHSRQFIDNGAIAVVGHHPHIIQGIEKYKDGVIAYSLGSFIYIPENELGYSKNQGGNRDYSICLSLKFDKTRLIGIEPVYYKYDRDLKIPIKTNDKNPYFIELNDLIYNPKAYHKKVREVLFRREIVSFLQRFRKSPLSTVKHYANYLKISHIRKMFSWIMLTSVLIYSINFYPIKGALV